MMRKVVAARALCISVVFSLLLMFTGVSLASAAESGIREYEEQGVVLTEEQVNDFAEQTADSFVVLFRDVIKKKNNQYYADYTVADEHGFAESHEQIDLIIVSLNGAKENPYISKHSDRSWGSIGQCVVTGVLGFSPFQIDYNLLGQYIYEKAWNKVEDLLKAYAKKEIKKKAGNVVLKQIIKSTPAGFAAWLGVYAVGCAAKEAWNAWRP